MEVKIKLAKKTDLLEYTGLLQKIYQEAYVNEAIGLTRECFSEEIFNTVDTQEYLASNLEVNEKQKAWLAFIGAKLIGSISILERENEYELRGFYVATDFQNKGIGKKLWQLVQEFAKDKNITCDIYAHNVKTIAIYKKWGFEVDIEKGEFYRHWAEWPEELQAKCIYMRYKVK